jgi:hypothetical protein
MVRAPTMDELRTANFRFNMLDEKVICPRMTLSGRLWETFLDLAPVFLLQTNFITSGLLLAIVASHSAMNVVGQVHMLHLLSKACRNEPFPNEELKNGTLDCRNLIPYWMTPGNQTQSQLVRM